MKKLLAISLLLVLTLATIEVTGGDTAQHNAVSRLLFRNIPDGKLKEGLNNIENLKYIYGDWIKLERDTNGYLVYDPCNGDNPRIRIEKGTLIMHHTLDSPDTLAIDTFMIDGQKANLCIVASSENSLYRFEVTVPDEADKLVLWRIRQIDDSGDYQYQQVMTPKEYEKGFRHIDNPCPDSMKPEIQFLPVDY